MTTMKKATRTGFAAPLLAIALVVLPTQVQAQAGFTLDDIGFLAGCWAGTMGSLDMREQWSEPEAGLMLGSTRYLRNGDVAGFEFGMFSEEEGGVTLWPYPSGERSEHGFPLVRIADDGREFVFENMEHDFPVRIVYARTGVDELAPRIEGRDGDGQGWALRRTSCPGNDP